MTLTEQECHTIVHNVCSGWTYEDFEQDDPEFAQRCRDIIDFCIMAVYDIGLGQSNEVDSDL